MTEPLETRVARLELMLGLHPDEELGWVAAIVQDAGAAYGLRIDQVRDQSREQSAVRARWVAAWAARQIDAAVSTRTLAHALRREDHGTIIHALRRAERLRASDTEFARIAEDVVRMARARAERIEQNRRKL